MKKEEYELALKKREAINIDMVNAGLLFYELQKKLANIDTKIEDSICRI